VAQFIITSLSQLIEHAHHGVGVREIVKERVGRVGA
jgi:hypothetical protein